MLWDFRDSSTVKATRILHRCLPPYVISFHRLAPKALFPVTGLRLIQSAFWGRGISPSHIQDWPSIWSLERANIRHTKTETKVSHTVECICDSLRIVNAVGFSAKTFLLLHKLFTFCAYFSHLSVIQPTPVVSPSKAWGCGCSLSLILDSNPSEDIDVCLWYALCVVRYNSINRANY